MICFLYIRYSALEKEKNALFYNRRSEFRKEFCIFEELDIKVANERKGESKSHKN